MIERDPDSHKGDNGKVMIIAGSAQFHGAPILCSLGAEYSGADLIHPFIPPCHLEAAKGYSLNFILHHFQADNLGLRDVKGILHFSEQMDAVVIGPGLGSDSKTKSAIKEILAGLKVPTVIDASALIYTNNLPRETVLTPHRGEFTALTDDEPTPDNVQKWARDMGCVILCKGPEDIIASADDIVINDTGSPLMTVGGTGDVLAGVVGGLLAQGLSPFEAAIRAAKVVGRTAENLESLQGTLRAIDIAHALPSMLKKD